MNSWFEIAQNAIEQPPPECSIVSHQHGEMYSATQLSRHAEQRKRGSETRSTPEDRRQSLNLTATSSSPVA
jgi:hypothetical protein